MTDGPFHENNGTRKPQHDGPEDVRPDQHSADAQEHSDKNAQRAVHLAEVTNQSHAAPLSRTLNE